MSRLLTVVLTLALLGVAAPGADAAARVRLTASDNTPVVGRPVALTADVGVRGRRVVFQKRTGQGWRAIGSDHSDRRGKATVRVRFNRVGRVTVRAVAANGSDALTLRVVKAPTIVAASFPPGPWRVGVPVSTPVQVTPAKPGRMAWLERRDGDTWVKATTNFTTDALGAATVRWTPPEVGMETVRIRVGPSATHRPGTSAPAEREVRAGAGGGFLYGGGLEATQEVRDAPGHPDGIFVACVGFQPPPTGAVPTFEVALQQAKAYVADATAEDSDAWDELPARNDSGLLDQVAAIAVADRRYDAALAATLRAYELDPTDSVNLSNAAAAANLVDHPEWAIAFARKAAEAGPAPSVGVRQDAVRLVNLGHGYALRRQWDLAVQALRQAAAVDPESQAVQAELGAVLACQGNKTAALPHVRRSLRTDDTADPIELQNGDDETSRRTLIDSSTVYDLSGGADQSLILPYVPGTWGELVGRARLSGGNSYYADELEAYNQYILALYQRRNALEVQLSQRMQSWAPARVRIVNDILRRIGTSYDREITQAWDDYLEVQDQAIGPNNCQGMFPGHPYCGDQSGNTCSQSHSVFNEWERRIEYWGDALSAYHDATAEHFSGLQALLKDPVAHELAGIRGELEFSTPVHSMLANLRLTADLFVGYNEGYDGHQEGDPPCVGISVPTEPDPEVKSERAAATPCSDGSPLADLDLNIDLLVVSVSIGCEGWSIEATRGVLWLEAFARVEGDWATNGLVVNVGIKAGGGGASVETGFYYQQDGGGKVVDYGWQASASVQAGGLVSMDLYDDTVRVSFMSAFSSPH
ncbi:tetratricopeptide repeat protein [Nocardioides immobilis]|uniref:tetratricopeptide repeat protein n=1 Tax=Nocardioides immobilis TaxID=2049295 RepID=UPI0015FA70FA|nr:hypothetical protein [Nocardioides immobilis]